MQKLKRTSLRAGAHTGVAISSIRVKIISVPFNIEHLKFTMLSTLLLHRSALQEIPTAATQPRNDKKQRPWAVHHSDKSPLNSVYFRSSALKILEIHPVFLRFLP